MTNNTKQVHNNFEILSEEEDIYNRIRSFYTDTYEKLHTTVTTPYVFLDDCKNRVLKETIENFKKDINLLYNTLVEEEDKYLKKEWEKIKNICYLKDIIVLNKDKKYYNKTKNVNMLNQLKLKSVDEGTYHVQEYHFLTEPLPEKEVDNIIKKTQSIVNLNIKLCFGDIDFLGTIKINKK
jgi:hypothetical protein